MLEWGSDLLYKKWSFVLLCTVWSLTGCVSQKRCNKQLRDFFCEKRTTMICYSGDEKDGDIEEIVGLKNIID